MHYVVLAGSLLVISGVMSCAANVDGEPLSLAQSDVGEVGHVVQALGAASAADLAQPELDLVTPTDVWWMHEASEATINAKVAEGYRLFRLNVASASPLLFSAAFVRNSGVYARTGGGWAHGRTRAQVQTIAADAARRIIDVTPYSVGNGTRYTVVWIGNTGAQRKRSTVVLGGTSLLDLQLRAIAFNGRITDVEHNVSSIQTCILFICITTPVTEYTAVMVERAGADVRNQWAFETTVAGAKAVKELLGSQRIIAFDHISGDNFVFIGENQNPDELHWFYDDLTFAGLPNTDITNVAHSDNIATLQRRLNARFTELKRYNDAGATRYMALLVDNGAVPQEGPAAGSDPLLNALDDVMTTAVKTYGLPGASLAVSVGDRLIHAQGYGHSHIGFDAAGDPRRVQPTDMFRLASVAKSITAMAILRLIEDGSIVPRTGQPLTLGTPIFGGIFDPATDPRLNTVTVRNLLMHVSAFRDTFAWTNNVVAFRSAMSVVDPVRTVGTTFMYQNSNYHLLTLAIEAITGRTYADYVDDALLDPLYVERMQIARPRANVFTSAATPLEAANYSAVSQFRRDPTPLQVDDWILDSTARYGASSWSASPIDLLRVLSSADGSKPGVRVLDDFTRVNQTNMLGQYQLGFTLVDRGGGVTSLENNGWLPGSTRAGIAVRSDGIKFVWAASADDVEVDGVDVLSFIQNGLHAALSATPAPAGIDRWEDYGFARVPCNADFMHLPAERLQDCADFWTSRGVWPVTVSSNVVAGQVFFSGSFQATAEHPLRPLRNEQAYVDDFVALRGLGYRPSQVNVVAIDGVDRFTGVWEAIDAPFEHRIDMTEQELVDLYWQMDAQGFVPVDLFVYGNGTRYLGTWEQRPHTGSGLYKGMTAAEYQTRVDELWVHGIYPQRFVAYDTPAGERYAAIWEAAPGDWAHRYDMTGADYQQHYNDNSALGMRLHNVQAYRDRFSSIWTKP